MIEIKLLKQEQLNDFTLIEGFPSIGLVGPMALSYLIEKMNMEYLGYVYSDSFPPIISIHSSIPQPPVRIYASKKEKLLCVFAEFAIPVELVYELGNALSDWK